MGDVESKVLILLEDSERGMTITELVGKSGLARGAIRISLAKLEGAGKIFFREVGMAKLYFMKG
jgi:GTP-sensing pleiotropic transcriptional regulator CodY